MSNKLTIEKIIIRKISKKLKNPLKNSITTINYKSFLIIEVYNKCGAIGYGECVAFSEPWYTEETTETSLYILNKFLIPMIKEKQIQHPKQLQTIFSKIKRHHMAKAAIECAFWDLYAKVQNKSLAQIIGAQKNKVEAGISLGIPNDLNKFIHTIENYLEKGYKRVKLKISPNNDYKIIQKVRDCFPNLRLMVDANGSYSLKDLKVLKEMEKFNLEMIEQPLPPEQLLDYKILKRKLDIPICLDESIDSLSNTKVAIDLNIVDILTLKIGRIGGIYHSLQLIEFCKKKNIPLWMGGMFETGIGRAFNIILASKFYKSLPHDLGESSHYWHEDIIYEPFEIKDGFVEVPKGIGIGVEVNHTILKKDTEKKIIYKF